MINFIFVVIELFFRYLLRLRRYERKSVEVGVFRRGWVTLSADFRGKGASPINHCWCQSSRVIALSCGIKIFAMRHLVLSQSTRVTDGQTDGQTDRITTPKTALAYARAVKMFAFHNSPPAISAPMFSTPALWCHIFRSHEFSIPISLSVKATANVPG